MSPPIEPDRNALRLAERLTQLLDRGGFTATYKYAVLVAIMDLCMEDTVAGHGGHPESLTTRQLAEKVIELYWPHCAPYDGGIILRQNTGSIKRAGEKVPTQAEIIRRIQCFRKESDPDPASTLSLTRARAAAPAAYEKLARLIEWKLVEMPLPRLQVISRGREHEEDRFLYDHSFHGVPQKDVSNLQNGRPSDFDNRIWLKPGVAAALIALNSVLRPLIHRNWALMVAAMNGLEGPRLEEFLFGSKRISLDPVRPWLPDLQENKCFYCRKGLPSAYHIDHFIPWSRRADNSIDNLVAAHEACNSTKSDHLAAADHVERWRERSSVHAAALSAIAREVTWESHPERTVNVARAIYGMLPDDARLWQSGQRFVLIDPPRLAAALAA